MKMFSSLLVLLFIIMFIRFHAVKRLALLLFGDNKVKRARKPLKKQKENPVGCTREGKSEGCVIIWEFLCERFGGELTLDV